jgi:hypothetical protein
MQLYFELSKERSGQRENRIDLQISEPLNGTSKRIVTILSDVL